MMRVFFEDEGLESMPGKEHWIVYIRHACEIYNKIPKTSGYQHKGGIFVCMHIAIS